MRTLRTAAIYSAASRRRTAQGRAATSWPSCGVIGDVTLTLASGVTLHFDLAHAPDDDVRRAVDHNEFRLSAFALQERPRPG